MPYVQVFTPGQLRTDNPPDLNAFYPRLLAEGDSWFSLGSVPGCNLLDQLEFSTHGAVVSLAYPGDTVQQMRAALGDSGSRRIDVWASEFASFIADRSAYPFTALLLSGGGNDLIDAIPHLLKKDFFATVDPSQPAAAIDADALALFDRFIIDSFSGLINVVRSAPNANRDVPVFCHTYDYPTPNDAPATVFGQRVGRSWLWPALRAAQVPQALWQPLSDHLLEHLAATLQGLDLPGLHVVNTLDTIERAAPDTTGESGEWENEIHPNAAGYRKLADKLAQAMRTELNF